jgi:hypothetical protein
MSTRAVSATQQSGGYDLRIIEYEAIPRSKYSWQVADMMVRQRLFTAVDH